MSSVYKLYHCNLLFEILYFKIRKLTFLRYTSFPSESSFEDNEIVIQSLGPKFLSSLHSPRVLTPTYTLLFLLTWLSYSFRLSSNFFFSPCTCSLDTGWLRIPRSHFDEQIPMYLCPVFTVSVSNLGPGTVWQYYDEEYKLCNHSGQPQWRPEQIRQ